VTSARPRSHSEITGNIIAVYIWALLVSDTEFRADCWRALTSLHLPSVVGSVVLLAFFWVMAVCLLVIAVGVSLAPFSRRPNLRGDREVIELLAVIANLVSATGFALHLRGASLHWWQFILPVLNVALAIREFFAIGDDPDVDEREMRPRHGIICLLLAGLTFHMLEHQLALPWSESLGTACVVAAAVNLVLPHLLPLAPKWTRYAKADLGLRIELKHMVEAERREEMDRATTAASRPAPSAGATSSGDWVSAATSQCRTRSPAAAAEARESSPLDARNP
jgi:hypothetical protein